MKIVVTGAAGNIGSHTVRALVAAGHTVRGLVLPSKANRRKVRQLPRGVEVIWGDIRQMADVELAVQGQDVIIHMAYILPPEVEEHLELAEAVNVGGTRNIIQAAQQLAPQPKFVFASSLDVFGYTLDQPPPRHADDPVMATDAYSQHKLLGEQMVRDSGLTWAILRFADVPPMENRSPHPIMYRIPLATRIEALHPDDAGLAVARAVASDEVWGKVWLIGGGAGCQVTYREYLGKMLDVMGIGRLPDAAFGHDPYCTDWLDSAPSEALWHYQHHTYDEIVQDVARHIGPVRHIVPLVRPIVRRSILRLSPYLKADKG